MSRQPIHYHVMVIGDIPTRRQTELHPMLPPLSDAVPEVMLGVDQCFFCIKFGHRQGHCPEKKKKKEKEEDEGVRDEMQSTKEVPEPNKAQAREGYDEFRVIQVRPGVVKPYSLSALWPSLFTVKPTRPAATTATAMASSLHATAVISSTTSTSAGSATTISTPSTNIASSSSVLTSARLAGSSGNSANMDGVRSISNTAGSQSKPEWFKKRKRGLENASIIRAELCHHRSCTAQELKDVMF